MDVTSETSVAKARRVARKYSAELYAAVFALLALPFATLYANCTGQRVDTINAAGGGVASSKAEIGYWLSSIAMALAPGADVRPWRRAILVVLATAAIAAAIVGLLILLIYLTAQRSRGNAG